MVSRPPGIPRDCPPELEPDLGWGLGLVFRTYRHATTDLLERLPGGMRGFHVLLVSVQGEPGSQVRLAQKTGSDRTVMTYLLDDLEEAGLVIREPDVDDRRVKRVTSTPKGERELARLQEALSVIEEDLLDALDAQERVQFRSMVSRLAASVLTRPDPEDCP